MRDCQSHATSSAQQKEQPKDKKMKPELRSRPSNNPGDAGRAEARNGSSRREKEAEANKAVEDKKAAKKKAEEDKKAAAEAKKKAEAEAQAREQGARRKTPRRSASTSAVPRPTEEGRRTAARGRCARGA